MANVKISDLPAASTPLAGTELVPIVQGGVTSQATVDDLLNPLAETNGSSLVGFLPAGTGAVATTVQTKLREIVSVKDFGAVGDGVTDDTAAIQTAINYAESTATPPAAGPGVVAIYFPFGKYYISASLVVTKSISFYGEGHSEFSTGARLVQQTSATDHFIVQPISVGCSVSWDNLTMIANGGGGTGGACINITKTTASCNSIRIRGCTFGTPQSYAIKIQASDDVMIVGNLFDVSSTACIRLGTTTSTDVVSNCSISGNTFYSIATSAISVYNVIGIIISNNRIYPSTGNLDTFLNGYTTIPYQIKNIVVQGNNFNGVNSLLKLTSVVGLTVNGNNGVSLGAGTGATFSAIYLTGTCSNINITGNVLSGNFDTSNFYNDSSATVTSACIAGNTFNATGGTGAALSCYNTTGGISKNTCVGFTTPSVGQSFSTTGNAISPGVLGSLGTYTYTLTLNGVRQSDQVQLAVTSIVWPVPTGIIVNAFSGGANTVLIRYDNPTASAIGIPAHDFRILVTR